VAIEVRNNQSKRCPHELFQIMRLTKSQVDEKITKWLDAPDPTVNHNRLSKIRGSKQIAGWFLSSRLREWELSKNGVCWIHGKRMCFDRA